MARERLIDPALLALAVDACNDGVTIAEREGEDTILIYVNEGFERLTGYRAEEILYQDCRFLQNDDRDQAALAQIRDAMERGMPCRVRLRNYRKDGSLFWNELSITPVFNDEDRLTYYIGIQKDITAQVEAVQALEAARREADPDLSVALTPESRQSGAV